MPILVQKFGGTSVANAEKIHSVAKRIARAQDRGDQVVKIGGLFGEVDSVNFKEEYVILLVDSERGTTLKFRRGAIHEILTKDSGSAEDKK